MLKKACALGGLVIATASGALLAVLPASATTPTWGGGGWGWHRTSLFHRSSNFSANENALFNRIRIRIRNRNNNVAVNNQAQRENQRQFQFETP